MYIDRHGDVVAMIRHSINMITSVLDYSIFLWDIAMLVSAIKDG